MDDHEERIAVSADYPHYRVAILAPFPPVQGGMSTLSQELANRLADDGHKVTRVNLGSGKLGAFLLPLLYTRIFFAVLRSDIVLIISASGPALWGKDLPAILCARLLGKKAVLDFVGGAAVDKAASWGWLKKTPFLLSHAVVVPTKLFRDALLKAGIKVRFEVIPHSVDVETFGQSTSQTRNPLALLAAKGLMSYSGVDLLLDVFAKVQKLLPEAEFWIAGDGPCRSDLETRAKDLELLGVRFFGAVEHGEMPSLMGKASVLIHGTKYESFGIVLVEAMAAGLPIVAFDVGGIPEVVVHGQTGYLIPYGDTDAFASQVVELLRSPAMLEDMRNRVREHVQRFSWQAIRHDWYRLYGDL